MDTDELLDELDSPDWSGTIRAVGIAEARLRGSIAGDSKVEEIVKKLAPLAGHAKWEVRRAVAKAATHAPHPIFESVLAKLARDDNIRVRQAAENAALRRRDSRHASTLGKQHEDRINSTLDDIEVRFGARGREAVKRAAEQVANTFARELYHEIIKLVTPIATSADRLREQLSTSNAAAEILSQEADRIGRRVKQLRAVLEGMRAYTAQPALTFMTEILQEVIQDAANVALESDRDKSFRPSININVAVTLEADLVRSRFLQALTNVLLNAIESYEDGGSQKPIEVNAGIQGGLVAITVQDSGCGMSLEAQRDALELFATSKPKGTGFGLPLAVKIIESEHGGRLSIESRKGHGTVVRILIPSHHHAELS